MSGIYAGNPCSDSEGAGLYALHFQSSPLQHRNPEIMNVSRNYILVQHHAWVITHRFFMVSVLAVLARKLLCDASTVICELY